MNSLLLILIGFICLALGYLVYGQRLARLFDVNPSRPTPAHSKYDGIDYVPAKNWLVLFSHHFSSIAGAGPILGSLIACAILVWWSSRACLS